MRNTPELSKFYCLPGKAGGTPDFSRHPLWTEADPRQDIPLPKQLKFELAMAVWTRAVLLDKQTVFKLDLAKILLSCRDSTAAIAAAEAGEMARSNLNVQRDLISHGLLSQALMQEGDTVPAREAAEKGLRMAIWLENMFEQASLLLDIATVEEREGNIVSAVHVWHKAMFLAKDCGRTERCNRGCVAPVVRPAWATRAESC